MTTTQKNTISNLNLRTEKFRSCVSDATCPVFESWCKKVLFISGLSSHWKSCKLQRWSMPEEFAFNNWHSVGFGYSYETSKGQCTAFDIFARRMSRKAATFPFNGREATVVQWANVGGTIERKGWVIEGEMNLGWYRWGASRWYFCNNCTRIGPTNFILNCTPLKNVSGWYIITVTCRNPMMPVRSQSMAASCRYTHVCCGRRYI